MFAYDPATNPLNKIEWAFPVLECVHISMFAMSIGTISLVDLRLLGFGMRHQTSSQLARDTMLWTLAGLVTVITSGLLIFTTDPLRYYYNPAFRFKIACLLLAILYNYTITSPEGSDVGSISGRWRARRRTLSGAVGVCYFRRPVLCVYIKSPGGRSVSGLVCPVGPSNGFRHGAP